MSVSVEKKVIILEDKKLLGNPAITKPLANGTPPNDEPPPGDEEMPCVIATATYGTPLAKELDVFRAFRDRFIPDFAQRAYYCLGRAPAKHLRKHPIQRKAMKGFLEAVRRML